MTTNLRSDHRTSIGVDLELLAAVRAAKDAVGAVTLSFGVGERLNLSQASIGRKLQEFDLLGFTERVGNKGRRLTEAGHAHLNRLIESDLAATRNMSFLTSLTEHQGSNLIAVLEARRALEKETARLATLRISEADLDQLERIVKRQREALELGRTGNAENRMFHKAIADGAKNDILAKALDLVLSQSDLIALVGVLRNRVGGVLVSDHEELVVAIRARDENLAERAMANHIDRIIGDMQRYFNIGVETEPP